VSKCLIIFAGKQFENDAGVKKIKNIFKMNTKENDAVNEQEKKQENAEASAEQHETAHDSKVDPKIAELEAKVSELNDKYLRLYSEYDNFRKRTAKEKVELIQTAGEDVFKSILPVMDDFERAIKSNSEISDVKAVNDGVTLIYNKLKSTLTGKGLQEMKTLGETFDADIHEAITNIPAPSEDLKGKVVDELEKGYSLNGKIIRFAKVVIGQ
jgi:molecular chaperone GrpE